MPLHQELTSFDIKCYISRNKAGRNVQYLENNYYPWGFEMTMQKIQNTHLELDFSLVNLEIIFLNKSRLHCPKTIKIFAFFAPCTLRIQCIFYSLAWGEPIHTSSLSFTSPVTILNYPTHTHATCSSVSPSTSSPAPSVIPSKI